MDTVRQWSHRSLTSKSHARKEAPALWSTAQCDLAALTPNSLFLRSLQNKNRLMEILKTSNREREILHI